MGIGIIFVYLNRAGCFSGTRHTSRRLRLAKTNQERCKAVFAELVLHYFHEIRHVEAFAGKFQQLGLDGFIKVVQVAEAQQHYCFLGHFSIAAGKVNAPARFVLYDCRLGEESEHVGQLLGCNTLPECISMHGLAVFIGDHVLELRDTLDGLMPVV
jgi:hypothetical protein